MTSTATLTNKPARDLQAGDFIVTVGGKMPSGRKANRYRIEQSVDAVWAAPGARTLIHLRLGDGTVYKLRHDYPVQVRPAAQIAADARDLADRVAAVRDSPEFQAKLAARRRNR